MPQPVWSIPPEVNGRALRKQAERDFNAASRGYYNSLELDKPGRVREAAKKKMDEAAQLLNDLRAMANA